MIRAWRLIMRDSKQILSILFVVVAILASWMLLWGEQVFAANGSAAYTYDALGRVVTINYDTGVCVMYSYDANGNRLSQTINVTAVGGPAVWGCSNWGQAQWTPK